MLAVEVVTTADQPVGTYVFDEVDSGVGGEAAVEVGRRLARLAEGGQVVVVTHLPQVAAFGDHHLVVTKSDDGTGTVSDVRAVSGQDRVQEVARMLAGLGGSSTAAAHAAELLDTAARLRREGRSRPPRARGGRAGAAGSPARQPEVVAPA
jgi:DNA repair protein RecN (Recombination protein N)